VGKVAPPALCFHSWAVSKYIARVNALIVDDDPLAALTLKHFVAKAEPRANCTHVTDGGAALRALTSEQFDVMFLDLELPEIDGQGVLQAMPKTLPVIVVSAHTDFAVRAFDFDVVDYLVKPPEFSRFYRAWQKLLARRAGPGPQVGRTIVVRDGSRLVQIPLDSLLFLQAESNYTRFVCTDRSLMTLASLKQLAELLPPDFIRVHRSYIVNSRVVHQLDGTTIKIGQHSLPVGETYREDVLRRFTPVN
jgi:DNA-binding LytR/AlgR family response regulator